MSASSVRVAGIVAGQAMSAIKDMAIRAAHTPGAVSLAWGVPSFATPAPLRTAVQRALDEDPEVGRYSLPDGIPSLREAIATHHHASTGIAIDPDRQVLVTAGNMQGMATLLRVLLEAGDEVIVTDPGFCSHVQQVELAGGVPRYWRLDEARGWQLDLDALPALITARTRALILVTPSNPTGRVFERDDLLAVARLAERHDFVVLIDDPYSRFIFDEGARYFDLASVSDYAHRVFYLFTFSKIYAMSGWRLGYAVLPAAVKREALKVHDANLICAPRVSQVAGEAALRQQEPPWRAFARELAARRDRICAHLDALPELFDYHRPQGTYYVFPRIRVPHTDSREFALRLLAEAGVSVTPGAGFGPGGEHHVRMAFCVDEASIDDAFARIRAWLHTGTRR